MRILMASDFYAPFMGGAERQVELLSKELVKRGHEVHVATVWHEGLEEEVDDEGVRLHRLKGLVTRVPWFSKDPQRRYHPPFPDPGLVRGLRRVIKRERPDLVHSAGWIAYSCAAALVGTSVPLLMSVRDYGYTCATRTLLHRDKVICSGPAPLKCLDCAALRYGRLKGAAAVAGVFAGRELLLRETTATHSITSYVQRVTRRDLLGLKLRGHGEDLVPDFVIPSFLETAADEGGVTPPELPSESFILFVGALQRHKGLNQLLASYSQLRDAPPLVMMGTRWPDTPTSFPPGVSVHHNVPHPDVMKAWARCLFAVVPSLWPEPLGVVSLEAMSQGKAVVGTAVGGITDIVVDGETGLLVQPGDVEAMRAAMQQMIDDPELRERLGAAGLERVRQFTAESVVPRFEEIYRRIVKEAATRDDARVDLRGAARIHIIGGSGSGKTTLADRLAARTGLPVWHLDRLALDPATGEHRPLEEWADDVRRIAAGPGWITEGIQVDGVDPLLSAADRTVWLDTVGSREAARRVVSRFVRDATREARNRRGWQRVNRIPEYRRHVGHLLRALGETQKYHSGSSQAPSSASRRATERRLAEHDSRVIHCRSLEDVETVVRSAESFTEREPASTATPDGVAPTR